MADYEAALGMQFGGSVGVEVWRKGDGTVVVSLENESYDFVCGSIYPEDARLLAKCLCEAADIAEGK